MTKLRTLKDIKKSFTYHELETCWFLDDEESAVQDADHAINLHLFPELRWMAIAHIKELQRQRDGETPYVHDIGGKEFHCTGYSEGLGCDMYPLIHWIKWFFNLKEEELK